MDFNNNTQEKTNEAQDSKSNLLKYDETDFEPIVAGKEGITFGRSTSNQNFNDANKMDGFGSTDENNNRKS
jgi:hypothetical protein